MKLTCLCSCSAAAALVAPATAFAGALILTSNPGLTIPDNSSLGVNDTIHATYDGHHSIMALRVTLDITGGYNGDLYAYLWHEADEEVGFAVLLNRSGRTASNPFGYGDSGYSVTFDDSASTDIHVYRQSVNPHGEALTGVWQPDARNVSPYSVLDTSDRTAFLSSFIGLNPSGAWTLFVADVSSVGVSTLNSWSIEIITAPEPGSLACAVLMGTAALAYGLFRKRNCRGRSDSRSGPGIPNPSHDNPATLRYESGTGDAHATDRSERA